MLTLLPAEQASLVCNTLPPHSTTGLEMIASIASSDTVRKPQQINFLSGHSTEPRTTSTLNQPVACELAMEFIIRPTGQRLFPSGKYPKSDWQKKQRNRWLDVVRAIAIILVVNCHIANSQAQNGSDSYWFKVLGLGGHGVDLACSPFSDPDVMKV